MEDILEARKNSYENREKRKKDLTSATQSDSKKEKIPSLQKSLQEAEKDLKKADSALLEEIENFSIVTLKAPLT